MTKHQQQQEPKIIRPTVLVKPTEPAKPSDEPAQPEAVVSHFTKRFRLVYSYSPRVMIASVVTVAVVVAVGLAARPYVLSSRAEKPAADVKQTVSSANTEKQEATAVDAAAASQQTQDTKKPSPTTPAKTPAKPTTPVTTPAPDPAPTVNATNCLPPNPSPYATYFISKTNSQYLQTNSYANTTKLYAALQFAGLLDTINSKQYVVLAMDDAQWNSFSQAQLNWMNASPANMKSVIGWQVITSCITWNGVNPVKDMANGAARTVSTLNGTVTYTHGNGGLGKVGNGNVAMWDWFTSNGSVTIAGFVNTTSIP